MKQPVIRKTVLLTIVKCAKIGIVEEITVILYGSWSMHAAQEKIGETICYPVYIINIHEEKRTYIVPVYEWLKLMKPFEDKKLRQTFKQGKEN